MAAHLPAGYHKQAVLRAPDIGWVALALVVGAWACSSHLGHGTRLYADGRYVEAAEVFEHTESRLSQAGPQEKAEYGTYRGLTLLVLGDLRNAYRWLAYAYQVERIYPGSLEAREHVLLDRAWEELGVRLGGAPSQPLPAGAVIASQQLPPLIPVIPTADPRGTRKTLVGR